VRNATGRQRGASCAVSSTSPRRSRSLDYDKHPAYRKAIRWIAGRKVLDRQNQYWNNRTEQNRRPLKQRYHPMLANAGLRSIRFSQPFLHCLRSAY
jgi:transposase-like protein